MHELSLATGVAELVEAELAKAAGRRLLRLAVRVGTLAGVDLEALRGCLEMIAETANWGAVELLIEPEPAAATCLDCGAEFAPQPADFRCPACGSGHSELRRGQQVYVDWLEVNDND